MLNKPMVAMIFVFFNLFFLPIAFAVDCPIPDTGQTKCYDNSVEITCPLPGEDFYGQDAQYDINPQSYTKLDASGNDLPPEATSWVMVRDNVTGLIWEVKTNDSSIHYKDNQYGWQDAQDVFITALNSQSFGGHSDWRLPTVKELSTIVDSSIPYPGPTINTDYFPNTVSSDYWSSTTGASNPSVAWPVDFGDGWVSNYGKSYGKYVRAVRAGQCGSFGDFVDNEDGTVTDKETGLMWEVKESKDDTPDYGNPRDADNDYTWENALSLCENLSLAGYDDWRLPNRNELQSLVDYSQYNPSIDTTFFPNTVSSGYWSSTTHAGYPGDAWLVSFDYGWVGHGLGKSYYGYVRAVRAGQCGSFGDSDGDGICDDGDDNGTPGDNPCTGGETENCDDNCPDDANSGQEDEDSDGIGDVCDTCTDTDDDGYGNPGFPANTCPEDNCPYDANPGQEDVGDGDGVGDVCDNCPNTPNGTGLGSCINCADGTMGDTCVLDSDCLPEEAEFVCAKNQENICGNDFDNDTVLNDMDNCPCHPNTAQIDTMPPGGNSNPAEGFQCGDACECEGDFEPDGDVDGTDAVAFKSDFFRKDCSTNPPCNGDFECDGDVDGTDAVKFKADFFRKDCPSCGGWPCVYE